MEETGGDDGEYEEEEEEEEQKGDPNERELAREMRSVMRLSDNSDVNESERPTRGDTDTDLAL